MTEKSKSGPVSMSMVLRERRSLAENQVFRIYFDHVVDANGTEVPNYLVVAPKHQSADLVTGVSVLPLVAAKVGLLYLYRHAIGAMTWEVPRGFIDEGETDLQSARRELQEEAGLEASTGNIHSLGFITPEASLLAARIHLFVAEGCTRENSFRPSELGHQEMRWFEFDEAMAMAERSDIQDPSTLVALYRYSLRQRR